MYVTMWICHWDATIRDTVDMQFLCVTRISQLSNSFRDNCGKQNAYNLALWRNREPFRFHSTADTLDYLWWWWWWWWCCDYWWCCCCHCCHSTMQKMRLSFVVKWCVDWRYCSMHMMRTFANQRHAMQYPNSSKSKRKKKTKNFVQKKNM